MKQIINDPDKQSTPTLLESISTFSEIGFLSFGGPAAQISLMHKILVDKKKWVSEQTFLDALSFCMLLPGPEAMQLATYIGWRLHGIKGGLIAGLLFVVPGALLVGALAAIYAVYGYVPFVESVFFGIKAVVVIIVIEALLRVSKKALKSSKSWIVAGLSFIAIFFLALPYPLIVLLASIFGFFYIPAGNSKTTGASKRPRWTETCKTIAIWAVIWLTPIIALTLLLGEAHILSGIGWFFSKLAVVTFGGAYAVLAYMGQDVVIANNWLSAGQMMDGLGLAETTPGPLILVAEFVGYLSAYQKGGDAPLLMGLMGALVALWTTFVPCFMWIFAGAPYIDWINNQPRLKGALSGITAAVVGVILNLSMWFALHVFFSKVTLKHRGIFQLWIPEIETVNGHVVLIAAVSGVLLLRLKWNIPSVLGTASILALLLRSI